MSKYSELTNKLARQVIALRELKAERDRLQQQWSESDKAWLAARQEAQQVKAERDRLREALDAAPRWRDVVNELPQEAQEVLFARGDKTLHGAWIGGIFWHSNQMMTASYWMPLPAPPRAVLQEGE